MQQVMPIQNFASGVIGPPPAVYGAPTGRDSLEQWASLSTWARFRTMSSAARESSPRLDQFTNSHGFARAIEDHTRRPPFLPNKDYVLQRPVRYKADEAANYMRIVIAGGTVSSL